METRYYEPELDLDGTAEELFIQARNNYIDNPEALAKISEILSTEADLAEKKGLDATERRTQATLVNFMKEREEEVEKDFSVSHMKIDFMNGGCGGGLDEYALNEERNLFLSIMFEPSDNFVIVSLRTIKDEDEPDEVGAVRIPLEEFKTFSRRRLDVLIGEILNYSMTPVM